MSAMYARRTESLDVIDLEKLCDSNLRNIFGNRNLNDIIEKSVLSVTLTSADNEIVGYASFYDFPNVIDIDSSIQWNENVSLTGFEMATPLNCLFMHSFISQGSKEASVLMEIITTVFNTAPEIHYIIMNVEKGTSIDMFTDQFKIIKTPSSSMSWYGLKRESYMPRLHIRPAKAEDQDDLAPIFDAQTNVLKKIYGEFYIAEMIDAQNDTTKCLVAEVSSLAIGFMSITTEADINILNEGFFLEPFNGFKKPVEAEDEVEEEVPKEGTEEVIDSENQPPSDEHSVPVVDEVGKVESSLSTSSSSPSTDRQLDQHLTSMSSGLKDSTSLRMDIPQFEGEPSVVIIQLFAIAETYEMRSFDFVMDVFELFPTKDYLLITVPHLVPEFTLLENFVRIIPRPGVILPHELYAFHKGSLISNFRVRKACRSDHESIASLIDNLKLSHNILLDLEQFHLARRYDDGVKLYAFVAECLDAIVGVAILKDEEDIEYIRSHYNIEDFIYFTHHIRQEHGHIKHFVLNPIFKRLSKSFIKEVMRMCHKSSLYFPVYKPWALKQHLQDHSLPTILPEMIAVRPRKQIVYNLEKLENNAPTNRILEEQEGYCLMHINRKLIMEPKLSINARIVVVGASTTGLSFLESLVFCPHMKFNNIFLLSPRGLPDNYDDNEYVEQMMGKNFHFSKKKLELSALRIHVSVVKGHMTAIDRKKKLITVDDKFLLPYDHMIITTGLQYTIPCPTGLKTNIAANKVPAGYQDSITPQRRYSEMAFKSRTEQNLPIKRIVPQNMFTINDPYDVITFQAFIKVHMFNNESNVVIYGHMFESYCCLHSLLAMGIPGYRIQFVRPPYDENNIPLNNPIVEDAVYDTLREAGVAVHYDFYLSQYNYSQDVPTWVTSSSFIHTNGSVLNLECRMFISYYQKVVDYQAFRAMNDACLVFDYRLVIDSFFHTNDVSIRAAGPVTKFKRRYYSDQWNHSKFSSKVVGNELSKVFLRLFDPTVEPTITPPKEEVPLIPFYHDAIMHSCILPGGYHYLHFTKPNLVLPLSKMMEQANYGTVLDTGSPKSDQGYFRLHLDQYMKVESITCLRKKPFPVENYIELYGVHERALNNLRSRYYEGLITDLFDFFDESWAVAFYHDRFKDLKEELTELLMTRPMQSICKSSLEETIRNMMTTGAELTVDQKREILAEYRESGAKTTVDQRLISFIAYNYYHLPMYAKPDMI